jgi:hypothetical protein
MKKMTSRLPLAARLFLKVRLIIWLVHVPKRSNGREKSRA